MPGKLTTEKFIQKAREVHGDKYDYSKVDYKSSQTKVTIVCSVHGDFEQKPNNHLLGKGCPRCGGNNKLTTKEFIERSKEVHGDKYDYSKVNYKNANKKVIIWCPIHGDFEQKPNNHLQGQGCPKCSNNVKLTTEEFIKKAKKFHGDKYDYSKVEYKSSQTKVTITCSIHGDFEQKPNNHLQGQGCPRCSVITTEDFIKRSIEIHGNTYDYSKVEYKGSKTKVTIICPIHEEFEQIPNNHLQGQGCPRCGNKVPTTEEFIKKAKKFHGDKYDYSKVNYKNANKKVIIWCPIHGEFEQAPASHLQGQGCYKCNVGFPVDSKLSLLSDSDVEYLSDHQLIELVGNNILPAKFKFLATSEPGSSERRNDIKQLKEEISNSTEGDLSEEPTSDVGDSDISSTDISFEDAQNSAASEEGVAINSLPDLVTKELTVYDKYFVSSGERGAYLSKESVNKIWNCVLSDKAYLTTLDNLRQSSGPWLSYIIDTFKMEYKSVQNEKVGPDYKFEYSPSLMQKLMSYRIATNPYYGNWCGTGAGKTNAFLIASRRIDARVTVCVCPNSVVDTIKKSVFRVYPNSRVVVIKSMDDIVEYDRSQYNYIIFNYEKFSQPYSPAMIEKLVSLNQIDFLCFDEVHRTKNDESSINQNLTNLRVLAEERNHRLRVLGMTATPLINNLGEVRNLLELITGTSFEDVLPGNRVTINNIHNAYKYLMLYGFRYIPDYKINCNEEIVSIDASKDLASDLIKYGNNEVNDIEAQLVELKYKSIKNRITDRTVIYTQFLKSIMPKLKEVLTRDGITFREYTGEIDSEERESIISDFASHKFNVILASSPISTGVDGLQKICDTIIIMSLPWTNAEYTQLIGRINRQGSIFDSVNIIIPQVRILMNNGKVWSWDEKRFNIIKTKRTLSDAVVDGKFAHIFNLNRSKLLHDAIESLKGGLVDFTVTRKKLEVDMSDINSKEYKESIILSTHQKASTSTSTRMHEWFSEDKSRWKDYHKVREENIKDWVENPITVIAERLNENPGQTIADLGCGMNRLKDLVKNYKAWYSFDHCAVDPSVVEADCSDLHEYLGDECVDSAVFCMSLWGTNYLDSIKEAHRYLKTGGTLYVVEPKDKVDQSVLLGEVVQLGFNLTNLVLERNGKTYFEYKKVR